MSPVASSPLKKPMSYLNQHVFGLPKQLSLDAVSSPSMETHYEDARKKRMSYRTEQMQIRLLNAQKMSAGGMLTNGLIEVIEEDSSLMSAHSQSFLMQFKLMHHDYKSFEIQSPPRRHKRKRKRKDTKSIEDVELGQLSQNLFRYQELVAEQVAESGMKYTENPLTRSHRGFRLKSVPSIASPSVDSHETEFPRYRSSGGPEILSEKHHAQNQSLDMDLESEHNSYEKHFSTVFNLRRRVLKGYRVNNACLDCRIHLSALRCYEEHGLEYIEKEKDDFAFDTSGYDDAAKAGTPEKDEDENTFAPRYL